MEEELIMKHPIQFINQILFVRSAISRRRCRRGILIVCSLTCLALLPVARAQGPLTSTSKTANGSGRLDTRDRLKKRQEKFLLDHTDSMGRVRPDLWRKGVEQIMRMRVAPRVPLVPGGLVGGTWTQIGPAPLRIDQTQATNGKGPDSGEVVDIAIDPQGTTDQVIYIATNDGGIWKTTDGGASWAPKTDFMPSLSMGAVALDPGNPSIVYAGTGNLFDGGGVFSKGVGIYKSIDAGETWSVLNPGGLFTDNPETETPPPGVINRIVLPAPDVLLVATDIGLFRSVDGGQHFGSPPTFNNGQPVRDGFISDLDLDTATSTTVYASVSGVGIFQSTNSGETFPTNLFNNPGAPTDPLGFIAFAQSTLPNNQTLYASVQGASFTEFRGLFRSTDGGENWTGGPFGLAEGAGCQCGYDQTVGVDPQDAMRVYIGFQDLYVSTNSGGAFSKVGDGEIHDDHHALVFSPGTHISGRPPTRLYVGTDGGIATSGNGGSTWANINEGIATNLFKSIDTGRGSAFARGFTYGGTQDTGTIEHRPNMPGTDWHLAIDGDGGTTAVDPCNPKHAFCVANVPVGPDYFPGYCRTTDGGANWEVNPIGLTGVGVLKTDPNCNVVYAATSTATSTPQLWQSTDNGVSFTSIQPFPSEITAIATVKIDSNTLWVGLANGTVQRTSNVLAGLDSTWTPLDPRKNGAPRKQPVSGVAIDPSHPDQAVVVYPGFCEACAPGSPTRHVFRTTDNGANWDDISGNLPDLPLHSVVIHSSASSYTIIVASDASVLRTANLGSTWEVLGVGFPMVDATSLALDAEISPPLLRVGTYGRSVFELTGAIEVPEADLSITKTDFPDSVTVGNNLTYTVTVTNNGPATATSVIVTDNLPAETTYVSCSSTGGGVCTGSGNNRTVTFASLTSGESETITFVATVNCSVADGTVISNTATVSSSTPDPNSNNNSATATTTASNPPPTIAGVSVDQPVLWPPNHKLENVTVNYNVTDNCPLPPNSCTLSVTSNEPINGTGDGNTSPDWIILDAHHVQLRAERAGKGNGRIYTITITCIDSSGNSSSQSVEVNVPHDQGRR
jgi:uncharacterized repeat protein (TIGR01451 family)